MIIAVDFDGTCVEHMYPEVGPSVPRAAEVLHLLVQEGHELILHTMRGDEHLAAAIQWFEAEGIPLRAANRNPDQDSWTSSPKIFAHMYIDDAVFGCPLRAGATGKRHMVDWLAVERGLTMRGVLPLL